MSTGGIPGGGGGTDRGGGAGSSESASRAAGVARADGRTGGSGRAEDRAGRVGRGDGGSGGTDHGGDTAGTGDAGPSEGASPADARTSRGRPAGGRGPAVPRPPVDVADLVGVRAGNPEAIAEAAARRRRRPLLNDTGRLLIVAADHPARGALAVGDRELAMADRADLLGRLCLALSRPGVDGVLATADILDDLLLLGALENKVVMGSMNRGGLRGARFELDDRFTGYRPEDIDRLGFDAGKLLLRLDYTDPGSLTTLESAARAVDAMAARRLPVFVEPFISRRTPAGALVNDLSAEAVTRSIAIASGLGGSSAYTWLKVPVTEDPRDMARVLAASTLPAVLLGGDIGDAPADRDAAHEKWRGALHLPTVRGLVAGRSLLYPADGDVAAAVDTATALLREAA